MRQGPRRYPASDPLFSPNSNQYRPWAPPRKSAIGFGQNARPCRGDERHLKVAGRAGAGRLAALHARDQFPVESALAHFPVSAPPTMIARNLRILLAIELLLYAIGVQLLRERVHFAPGQAFALSVGLFLGARAVFTAIPFAPDSPALCGRRRSASDRRARSEWSGAGLPLRLTLVDPEQGPRFRLCE